MATCTRYLGDDLDTVAIHPSRWKTTKRQQIWIRPMIVGTRHVDFSSGAETNSYLNRARQMGKSLITASMQHIDSGLIVVLQQTTIPRVGSEQ